MTDFYTNNPLRNAGGFTTHNPTIAQGGGTEYSQTFTENIILADTIRKSVSLRKSEILDINDYVLAQLSGGQYYGIFKRWSGASWVNELLKAYLGGWQTKPLKRWNGNGWVEINIGG
jgi:hypothetical protein